MGGACSIRGSEVTCIQIVLQIRGGGQYRYEVISEVKIKVNL